MKLETIKKHLRDREYMSGVDRDRSRVKATGEIYTPTPLVQEILDKLPIEQFTNPKKTFLDPTCGDGQFLSEVVIKKLVALNKEEITDHEFRQALDTTYGADLMPDNCLECIARLYLVDKKEIEILEGEKIPHVWRAPGIIAVFKIHDRICNIVCADGLKYDYSFDSNPEQPESTRLFDWGTQ